MAGFLVPCPLVRLCVGLTCVLSLWNTVSAVKGEAKKEKVMTFLPTTVSRNRGVEKEKEAAVLSAAASDLGEERKEKGVAFLDTTELPARSVDLSSLNLTELVNGMLNRALKDTKKFFSLLSITSYSSFAFHKFSVAIYNISNLKTVDPAKFPTRYCYCLNNRTNDLSDYFQRPIYQKDSLKWNFWNKFCEHFKENFTALLVDVIGNSTSYLTEIFKSTSILSVSQTNESDCIFICVMTGKSGRNLSDFWEMAEKSPVINYTFMSSTSGVLELLHIVFLETDILASFAIPKETLLFGDIWSCSNSQGHGCDFKTHTYEPADTTEDEPPARSPEHQGTCSKDLSLDRDNSSCRERAGPTRRVARTPWVTTGRQAWTPTVPMSWALAGPPWETPSSTPSSPAEATATGSLSWPPARTAATHGGSSQAHPTSGGCFAGFARDHDPDSKDHILKWSLSQDFMNRIKGIAEMSPCSIRKVTIYKDGDGVSVRTDSGTSTRGTQTPSPTKEPAPKYPQTGDLPAAWPFTPRDEPALVPGAHQVSGCPQLLLEEGAVTAAPLPLAIQKFNPCLMELCRFFQQCLCMSQKREARREAMRYCLEYYSWFLKNATYICQRAKRVSHSQTLKQKCLQNICQSV